VKILKVRNVPMYYVVWPDNVKSSYTYNKTWAKEHCRRILANEDEMELKLGYIRKVRDFQ